MTLLIVIGLRFRRDVVLYRYHQTSWAAPAPTPLWGDTPVHLYKRECPGYVIQRRRIQIKYMFSSIDRAVMTTLAHWSTPHIRRGDQYVNQQLTVYRTS